MLWHQLSDAVEDIGTAALLIFQLSQSIIKAGNMFRVGSRNSQLISLQLQPEGYSQAEHCHECRLSSRTSSEESHTQ